ncbi:MAG: class I SAM-dependent methyltransferase [Dokdonella sp.]
MFFLRRRNIRASLHECRHAAHSNHGSEFDDAARRSGLLLLAAAHALPRALATGIDLWSTRDQSGHASAATHANAAASGIAGRIRIDTGDMRTLAYAEASFDAVVSSLAIHNLASAADRAQAVREIARVLKPGGHVALLDFVHTNA